MPQSDRLYPDEAKTANGYLDNLKTICGCFQANSDAMGRDLNPRAQSPTHSISRRVFLQGVYRLQVIFCPGQK